MPSPYFDLGPEFEVNSTTDNLQDGSEMAALADGGFVVVWESAGEDGQSYGIYAQRYDAYSRPIGGEILINTTTANSQVSPQVTGLVNGGYVVAWNTIVAETGASLGVFSQQFDADGIKVDGEVMVDTAPPSHQYQQQVAALSDGGYLIIWNDHDNNSQGDYGQRFNAAGQKVGGQTNLGETLSSGSPAILAMPDGGYTIVWQGYNSQSEAGIFLQRYDAKGEKAAAQALVFAASGGAATTPAATLLSNGDTLVTWEQGGSLTHGVFGQLFDITGVKSGNVITLATGGQLLHAVAALPSGGFAMVWDDFRNGSPGGIIEQQYDDQGQTVGPQVTLYTSNVTSGQPPSLTVLADGRYAVSYTEYGGPSLGYDIFTRVFSAPDGLIIGGSSKADTLRGTAGSDVITGGGGADTLYGGGGANSFVYMSLSDSTTGSYDVLADFKHGVDKADLSALGVSDVQIDVLSSSFTSVFYHVAGSSLQGNFAAYSALDLGDLRLGTQALTASIYFGNVLNEQDGFGSVGQQIWRNYFNGSGVLTEEDGFSNGLKSAASLFDGSGRQFEYDSFDASGHKTSAVQYAADGGQTSIGYNSAGAIIGQYGFAAGGSQTYANLYDAGGRLTEQDGFDSGGHRTLIISRNADASYSATHLNTAGHTTENDFYDTQGRITQVAIYNADASSLTSYFDTSQHLTEQDTANASGQVILTVTATGAGSYAVNSHADTVRLVGTTSADTFTGGGVSQTFVLGTSPGLDTIINFHAGTAAGHDVVEISKSLAGDYAHLLTDAQDVGSDVVITFDAHDTLTLHNLHIANLNSANFTFV